MTDILLSVECFAWHSYITEGPDGADCISASLLNNNWVTAEELASLEAADLKNLLIRKLNFYYSGDVHSVVDLSMREVTGDKGSLCGMSALYQAARQTILTVSQIKQMSFNDVKAEIGLELLYDKAEAKKQKDVEIISEYYSCKKL